MRSISPIESSTPLNATAVSIHYEPVAKMQAKAKQLREDVRAAQLQAAQAVVHRQGPRSPLGSSGGAFRPGSPLETAPGAAAAGALGRAPTPATAGNVFQRLTAGNKGSAATAAADTNLALVQQLQELKARQAEITAEMERRQASYMRREEQLKSQLTDLQQQLAAGAAGREGEEEDEEEDEEADAEAGRQQATTAQSAQQQLLEGVDHLLARQRAQMRAEAAQEVRALRRALADVEGQLQADKAAAEASRGDWSSKTAELRAELAATQEIAAKLDSMYKLAEEEAAAARLQFRAQEDDRKHLIRQAIKLRTENKRLQTEVHQLHAELDAVVALAGDPADQDPLEGGNCSPQQLSALLGHPAVQELQHAATVAAAEAAAVNRMELLQGMFQPVAAVKGSSRPGSSPSRQRGGQQQHFVHGIRPQTAQPSSRGRGPGGDQDTWSPQHHYSSTDGPADQEEQQLVLDPVLVAARMQRYSRVILKLQQLLQAERRSNRGLRQKYGDELARRTSVQGLLVGQLQALAQQRGDFEVLVSKLQQLLPSNRPLQLLQLSHVAAGRSPGSPRSPRPPSPTTPTAAAAGTATDAVSSAEAVAAAAGYVRHSRPVIDAAVASSSPRSTCSSPRRPGTAAGTGATNTPRVVSPQRPGTAAPAQQRYTAAAATAPVVPPLPLLSRLTANTLLQPGQEVARLLLLHLQQQIHLQQAWLQQLVAQGFPELLAELPEVAALSWGSAQDSSGAQDSEQALAQLLKGAAAAAGAGASRPQLAAAQPHTAATAGKPAGSSEVQQHTAAPQGLREHAAAVAAVAADSGSLAASKPPAHISDADAPTDTPAVAVPSAAVTDVASSSLKQVISAAGAAQGGRDTPGEASAAADDGGASSGEGNCLVLPLYMPSFPARPSSSSTQQRVRLMQLRGCSATGAGPSVLDAAVTTSSSRARPMTANHSSGGSSNASSSSGGSSCSSSKRPVSSSPRNRPGTASSRLSTGSAAGSTLPNAATMPAARPWRMNTQQLMQDFLNTK